MQTDGGEDVGFAISLFLAALGTVLIWGVTASIGGVDLAAVGWICLVAGAAGVLLSTMLWTVSDSRPEREPRRRPSWRSGGLRER
jgi:hypothetical protein